MFPKRLFGGRDARETEKLWSRVLRHENVDAKFSLF